MIQITKSIKNLFYEMQNMFLEPVTLSYAVYRYIHDLRGILSSDWLELLPL